MSSGTSLCSIKQEREVDLGSSLQSGGRTLRCREDSGSVATTFPLAKTLRGCQQVYHVMHGLCHCQTDH
jgi:hypothetical protein